MEWFRKSWRGDSGLGGNRVALIPLIPSLLQRKEREGALQVGGRSCPPVLSSRIRAGPHGVRAALCQPTIEL